MKNVMVVWSSHILQLPPQYVSPCFGPRNISHASSPLISFSSILRTTTTTMASSRPPPPKPFDLDLTIVSAKHLKNVNWKNGDLRPYAVFWVDPERRLATKSDDSGSTRPVWNERFTLPLSLSLHDSLLTLEIFHSKPSDTPKPLVGSLRLPLNDLPDPDDSTRIRTFDLIRPSGRPHGKIRIKLAFRERPPPPDYHNTPPPPSYFYSGAPMPPPPSARDYRAYSPSPYSSASAPTQSASPPPPPYHYSSYSDPYSSYYPGYYSSAPPPMPPRPFFDRPVSYGGPGGPSGGPSAPLEYSQYDQRPKSGKMGLGTGLAVGAVAGALGGLALEEGIRYEEDKIADRVENDVERDQLRDDYSNYRGDY